MADKAVSNFLANPLGFFLSTAKPEPSKPAVGAVIAPVSDAHVVKGRVVAVDDNNAKKGGVTPVEKDPVSELLKRMYGL